VKIAVCTPVHLFTHPQFTLDLMKATWATAKQRPDWVLEPFFAVGSGLVVARNNLLVRALKWGADRVLFTDADHGFPPDAIIRLVELNLPVVGANYLTRGGGDDGTRRPTAVGLDGNFVASSVDKASDPGVEEVASIGMGLCMIDPAILRQITEPTLWPVFNSEMGADLDAFVGEDTWFCRRLRKHGVRIFVDHALSMASTHHGDEVLKFEG
jgi:glycosyltransferase involved in cell wall biosynthesis